MDGGYEYFFRQKGFISYWELLSYLSQQGRVFAIQGEKQLEKGQVSLPSLDAEF